jgi:hypothetical protein
MSEMYHCETCDKSFPTQQGYESHIRLSNVHKENNPLVCQFCKRTFSSKQKCNEHVPKCRSTLPLYCDPKSIDELSRDRSIARLSTSNKYQETPIISSQSTAVHDCVPVMTNHPECSDSSVKVSKIKKEKDSSYKLYQQIKELKLANNVLKQQNKQLLNDLKNTQSDIDSLTRLQSENDNLKTKIEMMEKMLESEKEHNKQILQRGNVQNNNVYNVKTLKQVVQSLPPIIDKELEEKISALNLNHIRNQEEGIGAYLAKTYLNDRLICSDKSRFTVNWKDENNNIIKDQGSKKITNKISKLATNQKKHLWDLIGSFNDSMDQTNPNHIIEINNYVDLVDGLTTNSSETQEKLAHIIAKNVPDDNCTTRSLKHEICKTLSDLKDIVMGGLEGFYSIFCQLLSRQNMGDDFLVDIQNKNILCFSTHKRSYFLNDFDDLIMDQDHDQLLIVLCEILVETKKTSPYTLSNTEWAYVHNRDLTNLRNSYINVLNHYNSC